MEITRGKIIKPQRAVIYGPEGVGKSTMGSAFPNPIFIDTEGGTNQLDVQRTPKPQSWVQLQQQINELQKDHHGFETCVIDTADWSERLGINHLCAKLQISGLGFASSGDKDYGKSYNAWADEWGSFLDSLIELANSGMHVLLLAHARIRTQELPEEFGAFDHWELKLEKKTCALTKEWADLMLFANYKTHVVLDDKTKSKKASGAQRVLYTTHHACWDAKNRHGLPDEIPMDPDPKKTFAKLAHVFNVLSSASPSPVTPPAAQHVPAPAPAPALEQQADVTPELRQLNALLKQSGVTWEQLIAVIEAHPKISTFYPRGTSPRNWEPRFITGLLIPQWQKIEAKIKEVA